jgi:DNA-binding NtrC family response regulator
MGEGLFPNQEVGESSPGHVFHDQVANIRQDGGLQNRDEARVLQLRLQLAFQREARDPARFPQLAHELDRHVPSVRSSCGPVNRTEGAGSQLLPQVEAAQKAFGRDNGEESGGGAVDRSGLGVHDSQYTVGRQSVATGEPGGLRLPVRSEYSDCDGAPPFMIGAKGGTRSLVRGGRRATEVTLSGIFVQVEDGPDRGLQLSRSSGSLSIGTDPGNDLVLTDLTVSRRHALLTITSGGIQIEDLASKNGCWIQGARVTGATIPEGSQLLVGSTLLKVSGASQPLVVEPGPETQFAGMISGCEAMREVFALVRQMSLYDLPVLIDGETGTGKELVSRALHDSGPRAAKSYQVLDCGSLVRELLATQLFGHEKGAFTGATEMRKGIFETANGGTVVLDEIGEMELGLQTHLLRVLETHEICRLGSQQRIPVSFRVVSASHRDLQKMVAAGTFRADLYYRLSAVTIQMPPLRDRKGDVPILLESFLERCASRNSIPVPAVAPDAQELMERHRWPGNIRELKNAADALCVMAQGKSVMRHHVQQVLRQPASPLENSAPVDAADPERASILSVLQQVRWNRTRAARLLGMSRSTLYEKMERLGIHRPADNE